MQAPNDMESPRPLSRASADPQQHDEIYYYGGTDPQVVPEVAPPVFVEMLELITYEDNEQVSHIPETEVQAPEWRFDSGTLVPFSD